MAANDVPLLREVSDKYDATLDVLSYDGAKLTVKAGKKFGVADLSQTYTQTYSTADRTHAAATQHTITAVAAVDGATPNTQFQDSAGANPSQAEWRVLSKTLKEELNAIKADVDDVKQLVNAVIDDLQTAGLIG